MAPGQIPLEVTIDRGLRRRSSSGLRLESTDAGTGRPHTVPAPRGPRRPTQDPTTSPGTPEGRLPEADAHPGAPLDPSTGPWALDAAAGRPHIRRPPPSSPAPARGPPRPEAQEDRLCGRVALPRPPRRPAAAPRLSGARLRAQIPSRALRAWPALLCRRVPGPVLGTSRTPERGGVDTGQAWAAGSPAQDAAPCPKPEGGPHGSLHLESVGEEVDGPCLPG